MFIRQDEIRPDDRYYWVTANPDGSYTATPKALEDREEVDKDGNPIQGTISGAQIAFTYDYDGNVQRGAASAGDDAPITVVAGNPGQSKPVVATGVISRSKGIVLTLTAETDRAYLV